MFVNYPAIKLFFYLYCSIKQGNALALVFEALDQLTVLLGSDRPDDTADSTIEDNAKLTEKDASFPVPLGVIEGINQFVKAIPRENKR